jgi:hypothetical protein
LTRASPEQGAVRVQGQFDAALVAAEQGADAVAEAERRAVARRQGLRLLGGAAAERRQRAVPGGQQARQSANG